MVFERRERLDNKILSLQKSPISIYYIFHYPVSVVLFRFLYSKSVDIEALF